MPAEIQNYTVYAGAVGAHAKEPEAAKALVKALSGPEAAAVLGRTSRHGAAGLMSEMAVGALFFDVFGTLVDWRTSIAREAERLLKPLGFSLDTHAFADAWRAEYQPGLEEVRSGRRPFCKLDVLHRENLDRVLPRFGVTGVGEDVLRELNLAWHRLDALAGFCARPSCGSKRKPCSRRSRTATSLLMVALAAPQRGFPWDTISWVRKRPATTSPSRAVYLAACEALDLAPGECMMVAAHSNDLSHAAANGLRTGHIARPNEHGPGKGEPVPKMPVDVAAGSLEALAEKLGV